MGGIGRTLIVLGLLMFAFVGYQLWGTGLQTAQAQDDLEGDFTGRLGSTTTQVSGPTTSDPLAPSTTVATAPYRDFERGEAIALLEIPKIDLSWYVVEGIGVEDLKKGPGHFPETPMPGHLGNAAIAGHRTTYGHPFLELDQLEPGDRIEVLTLDGRFVYSVWETTIVEPAGYVDVIPTRNPNVATLTLATCHPAYTSKQRLIVSAVLLPEESDPAMYPPPLSPADTTELPDETPDGTTTTVDDPATTPDDSDDPAAPIEDTFAQGWFSDTDAIPHVVGWGLFLIAVSLGAWFAGKAARRLYVSVLVGFVPFLVVLYFFFENVNRLLPPGL